LTVAFEFGFGHFIAGKSWDDLRADYDVFRGRLWVLVLLTTTVAPYLAAQSHSRLEEGLKMREIVSDVYVIEGMRVNVYLLRSSDGLTMIDSGAAAKVDSLVTALEKAGFGLSHLKRIVLTHWHGDHSGGAAELARRSGAQILAHRDEASFIEQTHSPPSAHLTQRALNWLADNIVLRRYPAKVDRRLEDGDVIEALGGIRVIHTPGHTPGSICLYHPERQILFCGDAVFNEHPITGRAGLALHMQLFVLDTEQALAAARKLSGLPVQVLCCGHGEPILNDATRKMRHAFGSAPD
jgi:glyoxylase-like metal-dependent hydrolase (beta-lactamase superfamily II)